MTVFNGFQAAVTVCCITVSSVQQQVESDSSSSNDFRGDGEPDVWCSWLPVWQDGLRIVAVICVQYRLLAVTQWVALLSGLIALPFGGDWFGREGHCRRG